MQHDTGIQSIFVTTRIEGRCLWLRLRGPSINQREAEIITKEAAAAIEGADDVCKYLVLNMEDVEFLSSMGIGMLLDLRARGANRNLKIVLANVCDQLNTLLSIVKLEKILDICTNERDLKRRLK